MAYTQKGRFTPSKTELSENSDKRDYWQIHSFEHLLVDRNNQSFRFRNITDHGKNAPRSNVRPLLTHRNSMDALKAVFARSIVQALFSCLLLQVDTTGVSTALYRVGTQCTCVVRCGCFFVLSSPNSTKYLREDLFIVALNPICLTWSCFCKEEGAKLSLDRIDALPKRLTAGKN